jgi:Tol biopolymer transport system component
MDDEHGTGLEARMEGWKEIASFVKRDESTARRWEREEGLPVRRHGHKKRASVYAYRRELEAWREARGPATAGDVTEDRPPRVWPSLMAAGLMALSVGDGTRLVAGAEGPPAAVMTVRELMRNAQPGAGDEGPSIGSGFSVSSDGQVFVYTDWRTGDLARFDRTTGEVRELYGTNWNGPEWFEEPVLSQDDARVAFVRYPQFPEAGDDHTRIEVGSLAGGDRRVVHDFGAFVTACTHDWSPDGEKVLYSVRRAGSAYLASVNVRSESIRELANMEGALPRRAQYSPDGRFIVFDATSGGDRALKVVEADGSGQRVLLDSPGVDDSPLWTRDGRYLLFRSNRSGKWDLYALPMRDGRAAGAEFVVKSNLGADSYLQGLAKDDRLFVHEIVGGRHIYLAESIAQPVKTLRARALPRIRTLENRFPAFSPDGQRLVYLAGLGGQGTTVRITDMAGTILLDVRLEPPLSAFWAPRFSPDGTKVSVSAHDATGPRILVFSADTGVRLGSIAPVDGSRRFEGVGWRDNRHILVFLKPEEGLPSLATIDVAREQVVESTELPADAGRVALSPSGRQLLVLSRPDPTPGEERSSRLLLLSLEDGGVTPLKEGVAIRFGWGSDDRHVLYEKGPVGREDDHLYSLSIDTGEEGILVDDMGPLNLAAVSLDGKRWALQNNDLDRDWRIWALDGFLPRDAGPFASDSES